MRAYLLSVLTALLLLAVPVSGQSPALSVAPANPRQGEALFIRVAASSGVTGGDIAWRGERFPLYQDPGGWSGSVPISPDQRPGGCTLRVSLERGGEEELLSRVIEVAKVAFPIQRLAMKSSTARLYTFPGAKQEDAAVGAALRTRSEERLWTGDWMIPTKGRLSTPFGVRRIRNGRPVGRHRGLDIAAPEGAPVLAAAAGRVVMSTFLKKYGHTVVLDHGQGVTSLYIHMSARSAAKGQTVAKGVRLGSVGSTGVATGPHLHWATYVSGKSVQPFVFLRLSKRGVGW